MLVDATKLKLRQLSLTKERYLSGLSYENFVAASEFLIIATATFLQ